MTKRKFVKTLLPVVEECFPMVVNADYQRTDAMSIVVIYFSHGKTITIDVTGSSNRGMVYQVFNKLSMEFSI